MSNPVKEEGRVELLSSGVKKANCRGVVNGKVDAKVWHIFSSIFIGNGASLFYSLSVFCVIYGLVGIMTPLLAAKNVLGDKLICVGTLQGYEILLLAAAVIPFVKKKITNDSISLVIFIALFLVVGAVTLDTVSTDGFTLSAGIGVFLLLLAGAKLYVMKRSLNIRFSGVLSGGLILLIAWNYLVSPVMARYLLWIAPTSSNVPVDMWEFWRICWLPFLGAVVVVWYYAVSSAARMNTSHSGGGRSFIQTNGMAWIFTAVLLGASIYHQEILSYLYDINYTFGDFLPLSVALAFICGELVWKARCSYLAEAIGGGQPETNQGGLSVNSKAVKWLNISFRAEMVFFSLPLIAIFSANLADGGIIAGSYFTDIIWNPLFLSGCSAALILHDWRRYKRSYLLYPLIGYLFVVVLLIGGESGHGISGSFNWEFFGFFVVLSSILIGFIRRNLPLAASGTVIGITGGLYRLLTKTSMSFPDLNMIPALLTVGSFVMLLFYLCSRDRSLRGFSVISAVTASCLVMFCYDGESGLIAYRIIAGSMALVIGGLIVFRVYDLPVGFVLTMPLPVYAILNINKMNNWYYVIIGFLLLIAGTLFSIYKELFWKVMNRLYFQYGRTFIKERVAGKRKGDPVMPIMFILPFCIFILFLFIAAASSARKSARKISCTNNLKQIGLALRMYSAANNGEFPNKNGRAGLQMLVDSGFLENTHVYSCPSSRGRVNNKKDVALHSSYCYAGGMNESSSVLSAIAMDRSNNHDKYGNILYIDGHVKGYAGENWSSHRGGSVMTDF
jgi:prepilin-type processing-associated H-X9-DG protein